MKSLRILGHWATIALLLLGGVAAAASTINVPKDQPTVQAGINAANTGDTVLVAPGTYYENIDFKGKAITVAASGSDPSLTTIDGGNKFNTSTVTFQSGELRSSILSGFTIRGGGITNLAGGGIHIFQSAPTVRNNTITSNACIGIYVGSGDALIQNNTISNTENTFPLNSSTCTFSPAAVELDGSYSIGSYTSSSIIGNTIENNLDGLVAGGITVISAEGALIQNNTIRNNSGGNVGGIVAVDTRTISILQNLIYGNIATGQNGGSGNNGAGGLAIWNELVSGSVGPFLGVIAENTITGNMLQMYAAGNSATEVEVYGDLAQYALVNNIIAGSSSTAPALNCSASTNSITPLVIDSNDIYNAQGTAYGGTCQVKSALWSYNNISANPLFLSAGTFDFHLQAGSPAIDYGNSSAPLLPVTDLDGNPRQQNTKGSLSRVDMGAYEHAGTIGPTTVTTLIPSTWTPVANTPLTFTINVTASDGSVPTGDVDLGRTDNFFFTPFVLGPNGTITVQALGLPAGTYAYVAFYDGTPQSNSVKIYLKVNNAPPTITVTASPEPTQYADGFTVTATVAPTATNTNTPTGTVDFSIDGTVVASAVALSGGAASTTIAAGNTYTVGSHPLTAVYSGDTNFSGSTATGTHMVTLIPTTTTVTLTQAGCVPLVGPAPSYYYNQDFWACANTYNTNGGSVAPTGTFNFTIDGIFNCSILLQVPVPCSGPNPDTGTHQLGGDYLGDAVHGPSSAVTVSMTVIPDITTISMVGGVANPSYVGQTVTFTAIATGNYAPPTGTVSFVDNVSGSLAVLLGTVTLVPNAGGNTSTATLNISNLPVGTHQITAQVNASLDFLPSVSANYPEVILPLAVAVQSTVTLTSSLNPATYGQAVTFTAAIAATSVGGVMPPVPAPPTGTVAFYDGAVLLGTSTLNTNTASATFNTATLTVGGHSITAVYSGDANYLTQTSNIVLEVINPAYSGPPDFTLTIAQNPFPVGVGLTTSVAVTVVPLNGWTTDVTLACPAQLPYDFTCTMQAGTIAGGNGSTSLTLSTVAPHNCGNNPPYFTGTAQLEMRMGTAALAGLVMIFIPRKRRVMKALLLAVLCVLPGMVGCAGNCTDLGTYPGTYHIPITATGVGTTVSHTVDLQVQVNL
jgi:parallel beta-helix repeat protein